MHYKIRKLTTLDLLGSKCAVVDVGRDEMKNTYEALESKLGAFLSLLIHFCVLISVL